jgi:hypothetical protein
VFSALRRKGPVIGVTAELQKDKLVIQGIDRGSTVPDNGTTQATHVVIADPNNIQKPADSRQGPTGSKATQQQIIETQRAALGTLGALRYCMSLKGN